MLETPDIPGAKELVEYFGKWLSFHDAEVLSITLNRKGESRVAIEVTRPNYAVVTFHMEGLVLDHEGIAMNRLEWFNYQNVLSCAYVKKVPEGYELVLSGIFGVDGSLVFEKMRITLTDTRFS